MLSARVSRQVDYSVRALVASVNARHGTDFRLVGRHVHGESGAYKLEDSRGRHYVLKPGPPRDAPATTERLRALGYPAPRYLLVDERCSVQEELPGKSLDAWAPLGRRITERALELNELQADQGLASRSNWPEPLVHSVLEGEREYMVLETLHRRSDDSRLLLERCQTVTRRHAGRLPRRTDVVHFDFTSGNLLVEGDEITGVVDWHGTSTGDRLFDLATLFYYTREEPLRDRGVSDVGQEGLSVYLAHMCVRQTEWSLRLHSPEAGARVLRDSLALSATFPLS